MSKQHEATRPFTFHGVTFTKEVHNQQVGDCPFCGKQGHFHVNLVEKDNPKKKDPKTGKPYKIEVGAWDCKRCGKSGGVTQFLYSLYQQYLAKTTIENYKTLSRDRDNLPWEAFQAAKLAFDGDRHTPRWLIPLYDFQGKMKNLYAWTGPGRGILSTSGCETGLYYPTDPSSPPPKMPNDWPLLLAEGEWDAIALSYLRSKAGKSKRSTPGAIVLAMHGASAFDSSLTRYCDARRVYTMLDHDQPGIDGTAKTCGLLSKSAVKSLSVLDWTKLAPDPEELSGYDVRDYITANLANGIPAHSVWETLLASCEPFSSSDDGGKGAPAAVTRRQVKTQGDFRKIVKAFESRLHLDSNMIDGMAIGYATAFAGRVYGNPPVWTFLVGPPGAGKSAFIKSFDEAEGCRYTSTFKSRAIVSGQNDDAGRDTSLFAQWPNNCVFIKDLTTILTMAQVEQDEVFGILRDASDGSFYRQYGNGVVRDYKGLFFSMVAGVTQVIHNQHGADLGERFLKFSWARGKQDHTKHVLAAIDSMEGAEQGDRLLQDTSMSFMQKPFDPDKLLAPPAEYKDRIAALGQLIELLRTRQDKDPDYQVTPGIGTRPAMQLTKLGQCLCHVLDKKWGPEIYRLLCLVALDTVEGFATDIFMRLAQGPATIDSLIAAVPISQTSVKRRVDNLLSIKAVGRDVNKDGKNSGRPSYTYSLSTDSLKLVQRSQIV